MPRPTLPFCVLLFAALGLAPGAAHLMELPVKLSYPPELYAAVTSTLYRLYGILGGAAQLAALLSSALLAFRQRRRAGFRRHLAGSLALLASLLLWAALVAPVNAEWARVVESASEPLAPAYARLRERWEFGHLAAFIPWLAGYCLLLAATLGQTSSPRRDAPPPP